MGLGCFAPLTLLSILAPMEQVIGLLFNYFIKLVLSADKIRTISLLIKTVSVKALHTDVGVLRSRAPSESSLQSPEHRKQVTITNLALSLSAAYCNL